MRRSEFGGRDEFRTNGFGISVTSTGIGDLFKPIRFVHDAEFDATSMTRGYMKFSVQGDRLFVNVASDHHLFLTDPQTFHFNDSNGVITLDVTITEDVPTMYYGASFSPTGQYLYVGRWNGIRGLYQFDVSLPDGASIAASRVTLMEGFDQNAALAIQIGPDGKIYIATAADWVSVIHNPDLPAPSCNYEVQAIDLKSCTHMQIGLPNFIESYFRSSFIGEACPMDSIRSHFTYFSSESRICVGDTVQFEDHSTCYPELVERWKWNFNDPGSFANDSSYLQHPFHVFTSPGTYEVKLISGVWPVRLSCKSDTTILSIVVEECFVNLPVVQDVTQNLNSMRDLLEMVAEDRVPVGAVISIADCTGRMVMEANSTISSSRLQDFAAQNVSGTYLCTIRMSALQRTLKWVILK